MRNPFRHGPQNGLDRLFETRSEAWAAAGLQIEVNRAAARRASWGLAVMVLALIATISLQHAALVQIGHHRHHWIISKTTVTAAAVILVVAIGWQISRYISRIAPLFFRRMDPATAGTVGFVLRFVTVAATALGALAVAGVSLQALAIGGAFTAVVLGLAAQQTLGNLFAGMVLLSARPFRLGERVRLQAGALGGQIDGIVSSLGLLYTTLAHGEDRIMIPNNVVLSSVVVPLREPEAVDVRVRLGTGVRPSHLQQLLDDGIMTPTRNPPSVVLEELDGSEIVVRVRAVPERRVDGARLADEIIHILATVSAEHKASTAGAGDGRAER